MSIKIQHGTPVDHQENLCKKCEHSHIYSAQNDSSEMCFCTRFSTVRITKPVIKCNRFEAENTPSLYDLEKIAWRITADKKGQPVGFVAPKSKREDY